VATLQFLSISGRPVAAMSYLLYCIVDGNVEEPPEKQGFPLLPPVSILVRTAGLGAVVSENPAPTVDRDVGRLLAYAEMIECYNWERTVIPMRYGCIFSRLHEIRCLLESRQREYRRILSEVEGSVEMSARVAFDEPPSFTTSRNEGSLSRRLTELVDGAARGPGTVYLAKRSVHYSLRQVSAMRSEEIRKSICDATEGQYLKCTSGVDAQGGKAKLAVHFLVPREGVGKFVSALQPLSMRYGGALEVTGPWPPYNFVCSPESGLLH